MSPDPDDICIKRFLVSGLVQGVFYRVSAQREGLRLGLAGLARNLPDGRVEVVAAGPCAQVRSFEDWLWVGPPAAQVDDVSAEVYAGPVPRGFTVG